jgi:uroporphyrin-III C-methyltransferase
MTALGAPLTHRAHAHGVLFVTGHAQPGAPGVDWRLLAHTAHAARLTLVIYMGMRHAGETAQGLASPAVIVVGDVVRGIAAAGQNRQDIAHLGPMAMAG